MKICMCGVRCWLVGNIIDMGSGLVCYFGSILISELLVSSGVSLLCGVWISLRFVR